MEAGGATLQRSPSGASGHSGRSGHSAGSHGSFQSGQTAASGKSAAAREAAVNAQSGSDATDKKPGIQGVLTVHVKCARKLHFSTRWRRNLANIYVRLENNELVKETRAVSDGHGAPKWNQTKHMPVTLLRARSNPRNVVTLSLWAFDSASPDAQVELGAVKLNLHDVAKHAPVETSFDLFHEAAYGGELFVIILFHYGLLGYGYSAQLPLGMPVESSLQYSLYPRVEPPDDRTEPTRATLIPRAVPHPSFIPFNSKVIFGYGKRVAHLLEEKAPSFPVHERHSARLLAMRDRLNVASDRVERLALIRKQLSEGDHAAEATVDAAPAWAADDREPEDDPASESSDSDMDFKAPESKQAAMSAREAVDAAAWLFLQPADAVEGLVRHARAADENRGPRERGVKGPQAMALNEAAALSGLGPSGAEAGPALAAANLDPREESESGTAAAQRKPQRTTTGVSATSDNTLAVPILSPRVRGAQAEEAVRRVESLKQVRWGGAAAESSRPLRTLSSPVKPALHDADT